MSAHVSMRIAVSALFMTDVESSSKRSLIFQHYFAFLYKTLDTGSKLEQQHQVFYAICARTKLA